MKIETSESQAPGTLEVHVNQASELDDALTRAIEVMQKAAAEHCTGILVSRIDPGRYIVRAHPAVPFGLIRQCYEAGNQSKHAS